MDMSDDPSRFFAAMDSILLQQSTLIDQNSALSLQNQTLITQNANLTSRISALEDIAGSLATAGRHAVDSDGDWVCPVCNEQFKHRESYKGHIRRLAQSPLSRGSRCFLDKDNEAHVILVQHARYGVGDFDSCAGAFASMLYDTVKSASTSRTSSQNSHRAVRVVLYYQFHISTVLADSRLAGQWCLSWRCSG